MPVAWIAGLLKGIVVVLPKNTSASYKTFFLNSLLSKVHSRKQPSLDTSAKTFALKLFDSSLFNT